MRKVLIGSILGMLIIILFGIPVLGAYYANLQVVEANGNPYTQLALQKAVDVQRLVDNGYISPTGLDTKVVTGAGTPLPHMLVDDRLLFVTDITASSTSNLLFTTGNTPLDSFPVIVGDGGYVTTADNDDLELGNDFEIEYEGYMDTATACGSIYPDWISTTESGHSTQVTDHTVTLPGTIAVGDLLILCFGRNGGAQTITWPNGWTEVFQNVAAGEGAGLAYRRADGTEGASVTVQTSASSISAHHVLRIQNYQGTPEFAYTNGEDANPNPPSLTPSWGSKQTLWIAGFGGGQAGQEGVAVSGYPASYGNTDNIRVNLATTYSYAWAASCTRELTAVSEDPGTFTMSDGLAHWWAWTAAIQGDVDGGFVDKTGAFHIYSSGSNDIKVKLSGATEKTITATGVFLPDEYIVNVWADGLDFGIDIDGTPKGDTGVVSMLNNGSNWEISMPYFNYYTHKVGVNDRITYEPDSIIVGTVLPNELSPGTYNGAITFGSNPAGFTITLGGLISEFQPAPAGGQGQLPPSQDMTGETGQPGWTSETGTLEANPLYPLVKAISDNTRIPVILVWIIGATVILTGAMVVGFRYLPHQLLTMFIGAGVSAFFWQLGIYPFWVVFIFVAGGVAVVISERQPVI